MQRIVAIEPHIHGHDDVVLLDHDMRNRRRIVLTTAGGMPLLLDRPRAVTLRHGNGLRLDDGRMVLVQAADEALIEITAPNLDALVRIAWHLGNRHLPTQLLDGRLRIRHDHVIAGMAAGLGGTCTGIHAPFDPEGGAYAGDGAAAHHPAHHHDHGHDAEEQHGHHHG